MKTQRNNTIIITDAMTGDNVDVIHCDKLSVVTISSHVNDVFLDDYKDCQHGILIKYGIE